MIVEPRLQKQVDQHPYQLIFATISGAHLYGFPSADSDYDLRGVHLLRLNEEAKLPYIGELVERIDTFGCPGWKHSRSAESVRQSCRPNFPKHR